MMKQYGLIGFPLSHSFSKKYFDNKFEKEHIKDASFYLWELEDINQLRALLKVNYLIHGIAVTIPYKKKVVPFLDWLDPIVQNTGACNCIKIVNNKLYGYNTDILGFKISFEKHLSPQHRKALILGAGGASAGIEYVLNLLNINYLIVSRQKGLRDNSITYSEITSDMINEYPIIINCTPSGTFPNVDTCPELPYQSMTASNYLFDLVYNPTETLFLKQGKERGAITQSGYEMLVVQAEENWRIWNSPA